MQMKSCNLATNSFNHN